MEQNPTNNVKYLANIEKDLYKYLSEVSAETGKSIEEIAGEAIQNYMEQIKNDPELMAYLKQHLPRSVPLGITMPVHYYLRLLMVADYYGKPLDDIIRQILVKYLVKYGQDKLENKKTLKL